MKKLLSVLLCAILLVGLIPMSAFAAGEKIEALTAHINSQCQIDASSYEEDKFTFTMTVDGDVNGYIYAVHACKNPDEFLFDDSIYQNEIGTVKVSCGTPDGFDLWCFEGNKTDSSNFRNAQGQVLWCCYEIVKLDASVEDAEAEMVEIDGVTYFVVNDCTVYGYTQVIPDAKYSEIYLDSLTPGGGVVIGETLNLPRYDIPATFVGWYGNQDCTVAYTAGSQDCYAQFKMNTSGVNFPILTTSYAMILGTNRNKGTKYDACAVEIADDELFVTFKVESGNAKQITCPAGYEIISGATDGLAIPGSEIIVERKVAEEDNKYISAVFANGTQIYYWHSDSENEWQTEHGNVVKFKMLDEDVTLSFETCENDKLIIDANGGTVNFGDNGVVYVAEQSHQYVKIKNDCCTRDGYKLVSLNYKADGTGANETFDGEGFITLAWFDVNDRYDEVTLYAVWEEVGGEEIIPGDINGDGNVNNKDVISLFKYVSSGETVEDESVYDFNGDGVVNNKDVVALFRYVSSGEHVHSWREWKTTLEPTCTDPGEKQRKCSVCGETEKESIPSLGHKYGKDNKCIRCGKEKPAPTSDEYFEFTLLDNDTYSIRAKDVNNMPENVIIPDTHKEEPVTSIGDEAFSRCSCLTSVIIPDSITSIGSYAFSRCSGLTDIKIPDGVTSIGDYAFELCRGLMSITISDSVANIGEYAFAHCSGLTSITIPGGVTTIERAAFSSCSGLTSVTIPGSVKSIGYEAFEFCGDLTGVTILDGVTNIGGYAFSHCNNLKFNEYDNAFYLGNDNNPYYALIMAKDENITDIKINNNTKIISGHAFGCCFDLKSVTIPDGLISIGDWAFNGCKALKNITIPNGITSISDYAFFGCINLTDISMPDSVTNIGEYAFNQCSSLKNITIPNGVTSIGDWAFHDCSSLKNITIPNGVTRIGEGTFNCCSSLTSIAMSDRVTSIGDFAFFGCSSLANIAFNGTKKQWTNIEKYNYLDASTGEYVVHCTDGDIDYYN